MIESIPPLKLRQRAEEILNTRADKNKSISYNDVYELINELHLSQIELELLNEELVNTSLELKLSRQKYIDLYNFIPFGYFTFNQRGQILEVNDAGAAMFGLKRSQLINRNLARYIAPTFQYIFTEFCERAYKSTGLQTCELKLLKRGGPLFFANFTGKIIENKITGERNFISFVSDITERKTQEEDYPVNKNLSIEKNSLYIHELASILTYELNHPLSVISNFLHGCIRRLEQKNYNIADIVKALRQAVDQSHRISEIILRMKNFNCNESIQLKTVGINDLIQDAIKFIHYENSNFPINIIYNPVKNFPALLIDKIYIEQVVVNLARNAVEALRDANIEDPVLRIEVDRFNTSEIEICVRDNGPGISEENLQKLFNPYFTTKPYGVGLGLAVSRAIIKAHKGDLIAESNAFGGACFKIILPIQQVPKTVGDLLYTKKTGDVKIKL